MAKRLAVLVSGEGTNLQALIDACARHEIKGDIVLVISDRKKARGLERAARAGIESVVVERGAYDTREHFDDALQEVLESHEVELVILAGFMRVLGSKIVKAFAGRMINLHPARHGAYAGLHAIERAYEDAQKGQVQESGCMVHYVSDVVDEGALIAQVVVPIDAKKPLADFEKDMHKAEHALLVSVVKTLCE